MFGVRIFIYTSDGCPVSVTCQTFPVSESVERPYRLDKDILSGGEFRVCHCLDGGLVVCKGGALAGGVCRYMYVESYLECKFDPSEFSCVYSRGG